MRPKIHCEINNIYLIIKRGLRLNIKCIDQPFELT